MQELLKYHQEHVIKAIGYGKNQEITEISNQLEDLSN
jgi:hypothetical protein